MKHVDFYLFFYLQGVCEFVTKSLLELILWLIVLDDEMITNISSLHALRITIAHGIQLLFVFVS